MMTVNGPVLSYREYVDWTGCLVAENRTSGKTQSQALIGFTALNHRRMQRISKTIELDSKVEEMLASLKAKQIWYIIAENWCGDCAQNIPAISNIADHSNSLIEVRIIQRDENPLWMERYHTSGSKSIPKLISFDSLGVELFTWGPRPQEAQMILNSWKQNPEGKSWEEFEKELHTWYSKDRTKSTQNEIFQLLSGNEINVPDNILHTTNI